MQSDRGKKDDAGKVRFSLFPRRALGSILNVLDFGAQKYGAWSWVEVPDAKNRYLDALMRHVEAWRAGERFDPESGQMHLAHAACCVVFLLGLELGDRG